MDTERLKKLRDRHGELLALDGLLGAVLHASISHGDLVEVIDAILSPEPFGGEMPLQAKIEAMAAKSVAQDRS